MISTIQTYFPENYTGTLMEVGAGLPQLGSPTGPFREKGWQIISVEPNPVFCNEFRALGFPVLQYAAYSKDVGDAIFKISPNGLSYSSLEKSTNYNAGPEDIKGEFNAASAQGNHLSDEFDWEFFPRNGEMKTITVQAFTLNTILKKHHPDLKKIDVVIVDVEGGELEAIKGLDLQKYNPKVVVLENMSNNLAYEPYMAENGFILDKQITIDQFYLNTRA